MNDLKYSKKSITWFFIVVIVLSAIMETIAIVKDFYILLGALMWMPAIASFVALSIVRKEMNIKFSFKRMFTDTGFKKCKFKYILMGCIIPFIYLFIPYLIYWIIYPSNFRYQGVSVWIILKDCLPMLILGIFLSLLTAVGEEIGWRGFLVPALYSRLGLNPTLLITGLFWCAWHMPIIISGLYMPGTPLYYAIPAFTLAIFPVGVIAAILTLESKSVWPAAFLHAAHNNYDQSVFEVITIGDNKMFFVSETGFITIICAWILAIICYVRYVKKYTDRAQN